jgi:hypothetical protein
MSLSNKSGSCTILGTASAEKPSLLAQIGLAGAAAVITVTFVHPVDVVKVSAWTFRLPRNQTVS